MAGILPAAWSAGLLLAPPASIATQAQQRGGELQTDSAAESGVGQATRGPFHRSVVLGIVVSNGDAESSGRVEVRLPSVSGAEATVWAPILTPGSFSDRGRLFLPEVGEDVLVAFLSGDPERPVVLGGFWSVGVLPPRPGAPAAEDAVSQATREVRGGIRQSFESGRQFLVATGIVIGGKDPRTESRVKVKFPWLPHDDPDESDWAHVVQPAGSGRGTYFLPSEGDEVAVAFLQGDVRRPVVLGVLSDRARPPFEAVAPLPPEGEESSPSPELPRGEAWCCHQGEVFVATESDCRNLGGQSFSHPGEAERRCRN